jgi:hypothetical protein
MSAPQNTIAIVFDYDQTLSPSYMQDEVVFPAFGINSEIFWRRCSELVRDHGYDNELAYMKVLLDQLGMDRPTNDELKKLGANLNFYKGLPEMFEECFATAKVCSLPSIPPTALRSNITSFHLA